ncbi:MAG: hypothetical protein J5927_01610 [Oscillospiraceae bacterium]|nr:hypothetical protein [Oscillospiraceae bacterium]
MDKGSRVLARLMLGLFALLLVLALLLGVFGHGAHRSYMAAFAGAAVLLGLGLFLWPRIRARARPVVEGWGAGRTGLALTALCLLLHLAWVLVFRLEPDGDYQTFWMTATALGRGQPLQNPDYVAMFPHILGYGAFLGLFVRLFGAGPLLAPLVNVGLTTLSGLLLYGLLLRRRGLWPAACGYLLWCVHPSIILYNTMVLSEPYYTCLLLAFLALMSLADRFFAGEERCLPAPVILGAVSGALLWGVNAARPIGAVPIIALAIWLVLLRGECLKNHRQNGAWLLLVVVMLAVYVPLGKLWHGYATEKLGEEPASAPGYSLYVGFNPESMGTYSNEDMDLLVEYRYGQGHTAEEAQQMMLQQARERVRSGQIPFGRLLLEKIRSFMGNDEGGAYYSRLQLEPTHYSLLALGSNIWYYVLAFLCLAATFRWGRSGKMDILLLAPLYVLGLTMAQMLVEVAGRYHYSIIPMLILVTCAGQIGKDSQEIDRR